MFLVDQPQISFYLWLGLQNQSRKAENFQVRFPETWPLRVKVGEVWRNLQTVNRKDFALFN